MNNIKIFSSKQEIHQQACEWISRLDRGLSLDEEQNFSSWVNISKTHRKNLFEVAETWDDLSVLNELSVLFPIKDKQLRQRMVFSRHTRIAVAASFVFMLISCIGLLVNTQIMSSSALPSLLVFDARTSIGEQQLLTLADGSSIH